MKIIILIVTIFFSFVAFVSFVAFADNSGNKIDKFVWDGPFFLKGLSIEQIRNLAVVEKESKEDEDNPFIDNAKIPYYTFIFKDGLKVYCRVVENHVSGPHVQFTSIHVASSQWPILYDLRVGQKISNVIKVLGKPTSDEGNLLSYSGQTEEVSFYYVDDVVTKVVFQYYSD